MGFLKTERVGQLGDQPTFGDLSVSGSLLVVDEEQIAERPVDEVETNVAANLVQITVVLDQSLQEQIVAEGVLYCDACKGNDPVI